MLAGCLWESGERRSAGTEAAPGSNEKGGGGERAPCGGAGGKRLTSVAMGMDL